MVDPNRRNELLGRGITVESSLADRLAFAQEFGLPAAFDEDGDPLVPTPTERALVDVAIAAEQFCGTQRTGPTRRLVEALDVLDVALGPLPRGAPICLTCGTVLTNEKAPCRCG